MRKIQMDNKIYLNILPDICRMILKNESLNEYKNFIILIHPDNIKDEYLTDGVYDGIKIHAVFSDNIDTDIAYIIPQTKDATNYEDV